jgi:hypothetical protein
MSTAAKMAVPEAPTHEEIAALAYRYWESRGRPIGSPEEDWLRAERDVQMDRLIWGQAGGSASKTSRRPHTS